ncbi:Ubiquitin-conjugating enzyme E2 U [Chytridiales sp. JEL 0842]|nr:Ubiquitin-conjugating enzyme E2 U [Chytridiales sp. JEL 0842]
MTSSRASLLLQKELYKMSKTTPPWGIETEVVLHDIFHWQATIHGPLHTCWEGGIFKLQILFDEGFNDIPPKIVFLTVPFHPNVDMQSGKPCIEFLDDIDVWSPDMTIYSILLSIQNMLIEPCLDNPVNPAAAQMYISSPRLYDQLSRDCVVASRRLDAGLPPHPIDEYQQESNFEESSPVECIELPKSQPRKVKRLSFSDYHDFWKAIATTLPTTASAPLRTPEGVICGDRSMLTEAQFKELLERLVIKVNSFPYRVSDFPLNRQQSLWYGRFSKKKKSKTHAEKEEKTKLQRIEAMRKIYNIPAPALPLEPEVIGENETSETTTIISVKDNTFSEKEAVVVEAAWEEDAVELENWAEKLVMEDDHMI